MISSVIDPLGYHSPFALAVPHGFEAWDFPGDLQCVGLQIRSPAAAGVLNRHLYPVKMRDIAKFFTNEFWDREVPQYGLERMKPERFLQLIEPPTKLYPGEMPYHPPRPFLLECWSYVWSWTRDNLRLLRKLGIMHVLLVSLIASALWHYNVKPHGRQRTTSA